MGDLTASAPAENMVMDKEIVESHVMAGAVGQVTSEHIRLQEELAKATPLIVSETFIFVLLLCEGKFFYDFSIFLLLQDTVDRACDAMQGVVKVINFWTSLRRSFWSNFLHYFKIKFALFSKNA